MFYSLVNSVIHRSFDVLLFLLVCLCFFLEKQNYQSHFITLQLSLNGWHVHAVCIHCIMVWDINMDSLRSSLQNKKTYFLRLWDYLHQKINSHFRDITEIIDVVWLLLTFSIECIVMTITCYKPGLFPSIWKCVGWKSKHAADCINIIQYHLKVVL